MWTSMDEFIGLFLFIFHNHVSIIISMPKKFQQLELRISSFVTWWKQPNALIFINSNTLKKNNNNKKLFIICQSTPTKLNIKMNTDFVSIEYNGMLDKIPCCWDESSFKRYDNTGTNIYQVRFCLEQFFHFFIDKPIDFN